MIKVTAVIFIILCVIIVCWFILKTVTSTNITSGKENTKPLCVSIRNKFESNSRNVIIVAEKDNIGNQLFQIAAALEYAKQHSLQVVVIGPQLDRPMLNKFGTQIQRIHCDEALNVSNTNTKSVSEKGFAYFALDPPPADGDSNYSTSAVYLKGYFQSLKYFTNISDTVHKLLQPPTRLLRDSDRFTIALHLRRGDYKTLAHYHTLMPFQYYTEALSLLFRKLGKGASECEVLIFGDNKKATKQLQSFLKTYFSSLTVTPTRMEGPPEMDLWAMSQADAFVGANSSFSWWASFLGSRGRHVVFPGSRDWFGPAFPKSTEYSTLDLYDFGRDVICHTVDLSTMMQNPWKRISEVATKQNMVLVYDASMLNSSVRSFYKSSDSSDDNEWMLWNEWKTWITENESQIHAQDRVLCSISNAITTDLQFEISPVSFVAFVTDFLFSDERRFTLPLKYDCAESDSNPVPQFTLTKQTTLTK